MAALGLGIEMVDLVVDVVETLEGVAPDLGRLGRDARTIDAAFEEGGMGNPAPTQYYDPINPWDPGHQLAGGESPFHTPSRPLAPHIAGHVAGSAVGAAQDAQRRRQGLATNVLGFNVGGGLTRGHVRGHTPTPPPPVQDGPTGPPPTRNLINFSRQQHSLFVEDGLIMPYGRGVPGLPRTRKVTHRFCSPNGQMTFASAAPTVAFDYVKCNNLTDPGTNLTAGVIVNAGGSVSDVHDPLLTDQLAAVYDRYIVLKARIRIDFFNAEGGGATDPAALIVGVALKDDTTAFTNLGQYQENGYSKWAALGPEGVTTLMYGVDIPKFFGSSAPTSDSTLLTTGAAAPTNELFFHIWAHPIDNTINGAAAYSCNFTVYVEYDVLWVEPKDVTRSA